MIETTYDKNLAIFHLYEKGKYLTIITNKVSRKDLHYGFNKWRENYHSKTEIQSRLIKLFTKILPNNHKRNAFQIWKNQSAMESRLILANRLLNEYINTK